MVFADEYTTDAKVLAENTAIMANVDVEKIIPAVEANKIVVSNDAFAIGNVIQTLIEKIEELKHLPK